MPLKLTQRSENVWYGVSVHERHFLDYMRLVLSLSAYAETVRPEGASEHRMRFYDDTGILADLSPTGLALYFEAVIE